MGHNILEFREEDRGHIEFTRIKAVEDVLGNALRITIGQTLHFGQVNMVHKMRAKITTDRIAALLANGQNFNRLAFGQKLVCSNTRQFGDVAVEATAFGEDLCEVVAGDSGVYWGT